MSKSLLSINNNTHEAFAPVITVQMPVFNGEKYLEEAIESILNQSFSDFEFLILNDGSTDDSLQILYHYAERDSRIRLINRENRGLGTTQHELAELAQGEFIAQLDQDDVALPSRLELQFNFLRKNPRVVAVSGAYQLIDSADRYITTMVLPNSNKEIQTLLLEGHCALHHPASMMRNKQVKSVGGYDKTLNLATDFDLWLRLGEVANISEVVLKYRLHDRSASESSGKRQSEEMRGACVNAWQRRNITCEFTARELWRPGPSRASQHKFMLKYGWWAWNSWQRRTAVYYGLKAITLKPLSVASWTLLIVSLLKSHR